MDKIIENEIGKLKISDTILGQLAERAISLVYGDAWLSNEKGRILDDSLSVFAASAVYAQSMVVKVKNDRYYFEINIICKFGKSLNSITKEIINQLEKDIRKTFEIDLAEIKVIVRGIKSKEIAKKKIEFVEKYGTKG